MAIDLDDDFIGDQSAGIDDLDDLDDLEDLADVSDSEDINDETDEGDLISNLESIVVALQSEFGKTREEIKDIIDGFDC